MNFSIKDRRRGVGTARLWRAVQEIQEAVAEGATEQGEVEVRVRTKVPIGVAFTGDWHIGSIGTDYRRLERDLDLMAGAEGLCVVQTGDAYDNYNTLSPRGGVFEAVIHPQQQKELAVAAVERLKGKLLAVVRGCHPSWSRTSDDFDWAGYAAGKSNAANLGDGGALVLRVGRVAYRVAVRHKYKYNSSLNPTNTHRQFVTYNGVFDVVAFGHFHHPVVETRSDVGNRRMIFLQSGSYKIEDRYAKRLGGFRGIPGTPVVVFWPDERHTIAFDDLDDGVRYLNYIRGETDGESEAESDTRLKGGAR